MLHDQFEELNYEERSEDVIGERMDIKFHLNMEIDKEEFSGSSKLAQIGLRMGIATLFFSIDLHPKGAEQITSRVCETIMGYLLQIRLRCQVLQSNISLVISLIKV